MLLVICLVHEKSERNFEHVVDLAGIRLQFETRIDHGHHRGNREAGARPIAIEKA
ncbi:hypothetical protein D3C83_151500 [compost metagenome]